MRRFAGTVLPVHLAPIRQDLLLNSWVLRIVNGMVFRSIRAWITGVKIQ
jgi:hypothetical protein